MHRGREGRMVKQVDEDKSIIDDRRVKDGQKVDIKMP